MKLIKTVDAVGHVLCHDLTRILPGKSKKAEFRKGHIVNKDDIPVLLSMGKVNLYVWENNDNMYHENEAAEILCKVCINKHMSRGQVQEGKIEIFAHTDGLLEIDKAKLDKINGLGEIVIATRQNNFPVKKGDKLAGTRVVPLIIEKEKMNLVENLGGGVPLLSIRPFEPKKVAIIVTGSEVYSGIIEDEFGPALERKLKDYPTEILEKTIIGDDPNAISEKIKGAIKNGADIILCTGGMSVDPDDTTPTAIKNSGAKIISYGAPVLPGAMFLMGYSEEGIPIMGLPGCVMYSRRTIFDLVLPKIMSGERITRDYLMQLGMGGLCLDCEICIFPNCGFGR